MAELLDYLVAIGELELARKSQRLSTFMSKTQSLASRRPE
jgi:hypothetical protein